MYVRMLAYIRHNAVLSYRRGYSVAIPWRSICGAACGVCGRVAVWRGVASYMWIEVRTMRIRPLRLLVVVWRFAVSV